MPDLPLTSWLIFAGAWLAGTMAWSAPGAPPGSRARPDPLDDAGVEAPGNGPLVPLLGQGQALRLGADLLIGVAVAFAALTLAPVATSLTVTAHGYIAVFLAALGQTWSPWRGFRGGSATPVLLGGLLVMWPWCTPLVLVVVLVVVLSTGYLTIAVVLAMLALPLLAWWTDQGTPRLVFCMAAAALVLVRSAPALRRTVRGEESRFSRLRLLQRLRRA